MFVALFFTQGILLNVMSITLVICVCVIRNLLLLNELSLFGFPKELLILTVFLGNWVFIFGQIFEYIYSSLWNKEINSRKFGLPFLKIAIIVTAIVNLTAILIYVIAFFGFIRASI